MRRARYESDGLFAIWNPPKIAISFELSAVSFKTKVTKRFLLKADSLELTALTAVTKRFLLKADSLELTALTKVTNRSLLKADSLKLTASLLPDSFS